MNADFNRALAELRAVVRDDSFAPGNPEDQLKAPLQNLLRAANAAFGLREIETPTETRDSQIGVRPDIGVFRGALLCGYVELKAPGKGANPVKFTAPHDKAQWKNSPRCRI